MSLNPLTPVTDYQSMLNRIFWFTTAAALAAIWLVRLELPELDARLSEIDFIVEFGGDKVLPVPGGYLIPALMIGLLSRIYRIHAIISDWLGIRECFDVDVIIAELARQSGIDLSAVQRHRIVAERHRIMRAAFYEFVSGPRPQIDVQLIQQALDARSWFWIGIEATLVMTLAGFGLLAGGVYQTGLLTVGGTLLAAAIGLATMHRQCRRYAVAQVRVIMTDPARSAIVKKAFADLTDAKPELRIAA